MKSVFIVACFIVFDIITGFIKALYKKNVNSTGLRKGLYHKSSEILTIVGAYFLEYAIEYVDIGLQVPVLVCVSTYLCIMELISIIENLAEVNPGLNKLFKPYLEKLKAKEVE